MGNPLRVDSYYSRSSFNEAVGYYRRKPEGGHLSLQRRRILLGNSGRGVKRLPFRASMRPSDITDGNKK